MYQLIRLECDIIGNAHEILAVVEDKDLEAAIEYFSEAISKELGRRRKIKRRDWIDLDNDPDPRYYWLGYEKIKTNWTPETGPTNPLNHYKRIMEEK